MSLQVYRAVLKLLARDPQERGTIHDVLRVLAPLCESGRPLDPAATSPDELPGRRSKVPCPEKGVSDDGKG